MTRAEKVAEAQRLRGEGLLLREIAERMGVSLSTAGDWLSDPDRTKAKARRVKYAQPCVDCGNPTDGSGGYKVRRERCGECNRRHRHENRRWTREAIIEALQRFKLVVGRSPRAADLNPWLAERAGLSDAPERRARWDEGWLPHCVVVQREFGSFNAAVEAAGLRPYDEKLDRDWNAHKPRVAA